MDVALLALNIMTLSEHGPCEQGYGTSIQDLLIIPNPLELISEFFPLTQLFNTFASVELETKLGDKAELELQDPYSRFTKVDREWRALLGIETREHWNAQGEEARRAFESNHEAAAKLREMGRINVRIRDILSPRQLSNGCAGNNRGTRKKGQHSSDTSDRAV